MSVAFGRRPDAAGTTCDSSCIVDARALPFRQNPSAAERHQPNQRGGANTDAPRRAGATEIGPTATRSVTDTRGRERDAADTRFGLPNRVGHFS